MDPDPGTYPGSWKIIQIRTDPDPQHWYYGTLLFFLVYYDLEKYMLMLYAGTIPASILLLSPVS
jgi:hypothetical protein